MGVWEVGVADWRLFRARLGHGYGKLRWEMDGFSCLERKALSLPVWRGGAPRGDLGILGGSASSA